MNQSHATSQQADNSFGRSCAQLRKGMGLSQRELGRLLGLSEQTVGRWERGKRSPSAEQLKRFLTLALERQAFPSGHEDKQARELWLAAGQPPTEFEAFWMQTQLASVSTRSPLPALVVLKREVAPSAVPQVEETHALPWPRFDWGDALSVTALYGREAERTQLEQWVLKERSSLVCVLGMGGIGKSALATIVMQQVASSFQAVIFRSLRDALPCQELLVDCLHLLSPRPLLSLPTTVERGIELLLEGMQRRPCLIVLDNLETLLQEGDPEGHFRPGYEDYAVLLERVAQTQHQSSLLLTSREMPAQLARLEPQREGVRALRLGGLELAACEQLLAEREVSGSRQDYQRLAQSYEGNPLALNIVAQAISELFGGQIHSFLQQDTVIFSSIRGLLAEQWNRLSASEQTLLFWLAVMREAVSSEQLHAQLVPPVDRTQVEEALQALQRRSLVERVKARTGDSESTRYSLHSVVLEYVADLLVERVSEQIQYGVWEDLLSYALEQASAKDYVRQAQERLIVAPVLLSLQAVYWQTAALEERLLHLLGELRTWEQQAVGYGPANLMMLLRGLRGHLRGLDLSQLAIRGAYLQGVEMQDTTLAGASLRDTVLTQTFDGIVAVVISASGQYWAAGTMQGKVLVWREAGQVLHLALQAHTDIVITLAFSPDERTLASGSFDGSVKLWDVERRTLLWSGSHSKVTNCLAFSPDGDLLASSAYDGTVQIWDAKQGTPLQNLQHPGAVFALAWSPDGSLLATGDSAGTVRLWERQPSGSAHCMQTFEAHSNWIHGLAFAPDGRSLASASHDGSVKLWEVAQARSTRLRQTLVGHTERVQCVAWSPDGASLASSSFDHTVRLWDVQEGRTRTVLQGHSAVVHGLAFTPDSRQLLSGSEDGTLRLWEVQRGQCVRVLQGYTATLYDLAWSPDGTRLASGGADTVVTLWEVERGALLHLLRGHGWIVHGVAWSPDGSRLASSGWDHTIRFWEPASGTCLQILRDRDHPDPYFNGLAWSPDGEMLASGTIQHGVLVRDVATGSPRWVNRSQASWVRRVAFSPDGTRIAGGGDDGFVYLWQAFDGMPLPSLVGQHGAIMSMAWSPDSSRLAAGSGLSDGGELVVWDTLSGARVRDVIGHPGVVTAVTWNPNGEQIISGSSDGRLRWWDLPSAGSLECMRVREAHQGTVQALKVSPDGSLLASCGDDGIINVWDLKSGEHLRMLRRDRPYERLNITGIRGLTEAEIATLRALGAVQNLLR